MYQTGYARVLDKEHELIICDEFSQIINKYKEEKGSTLKTDNKMEEVGKSNT